MIRFDAKLLRPAMQDGSWLFLTLPTEASAQLPSRAMLTVEGTINGFAFQAALEPDGQKGHWLRVDEKMRVGAGVHAGDMVTLEMAPGAEDLEPEVPDDFRVALVAASAETRALWAAITPALRRDWIFWIVSPKKAETRAKRINGACDMLAKGKRRVCCFDRSGAYSKSLAAPKAAS